MSSLETRPLHFSTARGTSRPPLSLPFDNSGNGRLVVPGIGAGLYELPRDQRFAHGANDFVQWPRLLLREICMLGVMNSLTDKPNWNIKVFDEEVMKKWEAEAMRMSLISANAWDWCLRELRDKAKTYEETGRISVLDAQSRVSKSDTLVNENLRKQLIAATAPLANVPEPQKDWHPNSNNQVLNLVHPSLFPLVYGRTPVLSRGGQISLDNISTYSNAEIAPIIDTIMPATWSCRFQWLPCEVELDDSSKDVRITSYINNLPPAHKDVYAAIEKIIAISIDSWNDILVQTDFRSRVKARLTANKADYDSEMPEWASSSDWNATEEERQKNPEQHAQILEKVKEYLALPDINEIDEDEYDYPIDDPRSLEGDLWDLIERKWKCIRRVTHPDITPGDYEKWMANKRAQLHRRPQTDLRRDFHAQGLQVIVKLSSIELTPDQPTYPGGGWHVEGMLNEHIVATAIYYYDVDNVTDSRLSFRTEASLDSVDMRYPQDEHEPLAEIFGVESLSLRDEPAIQNMGSITTPQGRLLAFPNTLQHKVEPFELLDKSKAGHRRFLVLWLVDPHYRICSTRNVPPQQHDWWAPEGYDKIDLSAFPAEIQKMVTDQIGEWPMGLDEAKLLRLELMKERTRGQEAVDNGVDTYNFCEH